MMKSRIAGMSSASPNRKVKLSSAIALVLVVVREHAVLGSGADRAVARAGPGVRSRLARRAVHAGTLVRRDEGMR
jgi:hypothetical protein